MRFGFLRFIGVGLFYLFGFALSSISTASVVERGYTPDEENNIKIYKEASPTVVYVTNTAVHRTLFSFNVQEIPQGAGSGFIWDRQGYIVTNDHVIQGADRVTITLHDQSQWEARLIGRAPEKDLAVLKIDAPEALLQPLPRGDSLRLEVGRKVFAIGNPFGLDTTLTVGVVSALGREIGTSGNRTIKDVIQTDAAINPGNSGGPLLNSFGELIGVMSVIFSYCCASVGIGFAIPVNAVEKIVPQLIQYGRLVRPIMGVEIVPDYWARRYGIEGVALLSVTRGLPAEQAGMIGIRRNRRGEIILGDIIIGLNGHAVRDSNELLSQLEEYKAGDEITITTQRHSDVKTFKLILKAPRHGS